ncbi:hypothetical protein MCERE19_01812 [Spirosomataceae bacterium]|jgi:hypothetical protein
MTIPKLKFGQNILLSIIISVCLVTIIHFSKSIYISLLFIVFFSLFYGLLEPKKGWVLAIVQIVTIIAAYWLLHLANYQALKPDEAVFVTHVSFFPSLAASFLTSFLFNTSKD